LRLGGWGFAMLSCVDGDVAVILMFCMLVLTVCMYGSYGEMTIVHDGRPWDTWSSGCIDGSRSCETNCLYGVRKFVTG
jgi:hypothetical protein